MVRLPDYDARGVLSPSVVFAGQYGSPRWYLLTDPLTRRVNAYVMSRTGAISFSGYVGKNVGVRGQVTYETNLAREVIDVQEIQVLGAPGRVPSPPRPRIKPLPLVPVAPQPAPTMQPVQPQAKAGELDTSWLTSEAQPATGLPMAKPEEGAAEQAVDESEYE